LIGVVTRAVGEEEARLVAERAELEERVRDRWVNSKGTSKRLHVTAGRSTSEQCQVWRSPILEHVGLRKFVGASILQ
jgi:hypothetical protein